MFEFGGIGSKEENTNSMADRVVFVEPSDKYAEGKLMNQEFQIKVVIGQHNSVALLDCSSAIVSQDIAEIGFGSWWETALPEVPIERGEWLIKGKIEEEELSPEYYNVTFERTDENKSDRKSKHPFLAMTGFYREGYYCIVRESSKGQLDYWDNDTEKWCGAGTVFKLGDSDI